MIQLVCLGRMKNSASYSGLDALCQDYLKRVQPWCAVRLIEVPETGHAAKDTIALDPYLKKAARILLWTEHGQAWSSPDWSNWLSQQRACHGFSSAHPWVWVIAGPQGPDKVLLDQAHDRVSLSTMTFPHLVARLLVVEQLYRALAIANGVAYHK